MPGPDPTTALRFLLNGQSVEVAGLAPQTTLLQYLRDERRLTGTKEGCAEGDCGACTVVLAELDPASGAIRWQPINACIRLLPSVARKAVFTVEALADADGTLHPVQQALVDSHASQCGFCTPGFTMSLFGLYKNAHRPTRSDIEDALSGNLCRCTGYRPIVQAAQTMAQPPAPTDWRAPCGDGGEAPADKALHAALKALADEGPLHYHAGGATWHAPRTEDGLAAALAAHPAARIVAGTTDVGLWITKHHRDLGDLVHVGDVASLHAITVTGTHVEIGAAATLTAVFSTLDAHWPELHEAWVRFASVPIRNSATLGGNIANGSPIGDSMPALMALSATVVLRQGNASRELPLESLYLAYQKTALVPGEFVARIRIPRRGPRLLLRAYKISKRYDQDISAVFACFALTQERGTVATARIGCGGVAATPRRAIATEAALVGKRWDEASLEAAARVLADEFTPLTDMRATADYRRTVLANLLRRFHLETTAMPPLTRVEQASVAGD